jgi:hypothetical protein
MKWGPTILTATDTAKWKNSNTSWHSDFAEIHPHLILRLDVSPSDKKQKYYLLETFGNSSVKWSFTILADTIKDHR